MQVSQQDDHVTHAIIGNQETIAMGISSDAALMHILSATLYTYPKLAAVREIICNAWDAHIAAGITQRPIEIQVEIDKITVRDFGYGIAHQNIGPIYGVYGNSTKRDDSSVTGGFGLGSKAPFAYTDNFEVVSHHLGTRTIYRVSRSSMAMDGKPSINKIVSLPTEESGIAVSFSLKPGDMDPFLKLIHEVLQLGEIPALVNGNPVELNLPLSASPTGYLITTVSGTLLGPLNVRYGNVVYPIPVHDSYAEQYKQLSADLQIMWDNTKIIFQAPADSLSVAPSREALILTETTVNTLKTLLDSFSKNRWHLVQNHMQAMARKLLNEYLASLSAEELRRELIEKTTHSIQEQLKSLYPSISNPMFFNYREAAQAYALGHRNLTGARQEMLRRLQYLYRRSSNDRALLRSLLKMLHTTKSSYLYSDDLRHLAMRYVEYPFKAAKQQYPVLEKTRVLYYQNSGNYTGYFRKKIHDDLRDATSMQILLSRKALIAHTAEEAEEYLDYTNYNKRCFVRVLLIARGPKHAERLEAARALLSSLRYEVKEHFPERERPEKPAASQVDANYVPAKARKKGTYLTLDQSYCPSAGNFLLSRARECFQEADLIDKPLAWVKLRSKGECPDRLEGFSPVNSLYIYQRWGRQIAVVTSPQAKLLEAAGVPDLTEFVMQRLEAELAPSVGFKRYAAFALQFNTSSNMDKLMYSLCFMPTFMAELGLRFSIDNDTRKLLSLYRDSSLPRKHLNACKQVLDTVKCHPLARQVKQTLEDSLLPNFIHMEMLINSLSARKEDSFYALAALKVIKLLLNR